MTYLGYAHGAAGIADTLLDLFEVTQNERFLTLALGAFRLLERLALPALTDQSGLNWPLYAFDKKREMAGIYWCHGATGIGKFLLHMDELKLASQTHELVRRAARTVAHGARWIGPTQCHGLAGNSEFLLDMFQWTGDQTYYTEALTLAGLLETFAVEQKGRLVWPADDPSCISPDYLIGYAGVLSCLLRLADPKHRPHLLSRRGFALHQRARNDAFDLSS
jgi:lantibiotic modifying enzyme